jgi:hypothetical protein
MLADTESNGAMMADEDAMDLFSRKVRSAEQEDEHWTKITLECGHITSVVCYTGVTWMPCAQCVHEYVDNHRSAHA